jgi:hypothetical protein
MDKGGCPDAKDVGPQQGKNVRDRPPAETNRRCNSSARIQTRRFFQGGSRKEKRGVVVYLLVSKLWAEGRGAKKAKMPEPEGRRLVPPPMRNEPAALVQCNIPFLGSEDY